MIGNGTSNTFVYGALVPRLVASHPGSQSVGHPSSLCSDPASVITRSAATCAGVVP